MSTPLINIKYMKKLSDWPDYHNCYWLWLWSRYKEDVLETPIDELAFGKRILKQVDAIFKM